MKETDSNRRMVNWRQNFVSFLLIIATIKIENSSGSYPNSKDLDYSARNDSCHTPSNLDQFYLIEEFYKPEYEEVVLVLGLNSTSVIYFLNCVTDYGKINFGSKQLATLEDNLWAFVDSDEGTTYYAVPYNQDDLITRYLAKMVIDHSKRIKILLLNDETNYNYINWRQLSEYSSQLMPNITKFVNNTIYNAVQYRLSVNSSRDHAIYVPTCRARKDFKNQVKYESIYNNDKKEYDFKYISKNCTNSAESLFPTVNRDTANNVRKLSEQIVRHYKDLEKKTEMSTVSNILSFTHGLNEFFKILTEEIYEKYTEDIIAKSFQVEDFYQKLMKIFQDFKIDKVYRTTSRLKTNLRLLSFLQKERTTLLKVMQDHLEKNLKETLSWFVGISRIYNNNIIRAADHKTVEHLFKGLEKQVLRYNSKPKLIALHTIKNIMLNVDKEETCSTAKNNTFKLKIEGKILWTSDIPSILEKCKKKLGLDSSSRLHLMKLFASERVFIDSDLIEVGNEMEIVIMSPTWEVLGERRIILDGTPGKSHVILKAENGDPNNRILGTRGEDGLPGGPAGHYYGIGEKFINGNNLLISANGGNGSNGQDGGDGANGRPGKTYEKTDPIMAKYRIKSCRLTNWHKVKSFTVPGERAILGGRGGDGGKRGEGGKNGDVQLIELKGPSGIRVTAKPGLNGLHGNGGVGGRGAKNGCNQNMEDKCLMLVHLPVTTNSMNCDTGHSPDAPNGNNGNRFFIPQLTERAEIVEDFSLVKGQYKNFIMQQLEKEEDLSKKKDLEKFLKMINEKL